MRNLALSLGLGIVAIVSGVSTSGCGDNPPPKPAGDGGSPAPVQWRAAVGTGGTLVQTFDDRTWATRVVADRDLFGVACVGNLLGWAVGAGGYVAHTTDGGRTWSAQNSTTGATLRAVRFGDALHGVAVGDGGALVLTGDGGATWQSVPVGVASALRGVLATGSLVVAVGDGGLVARSGDGGRTFATRVLADEGDLRAVASDPGAHLLLAVSTSGAIQASTDQGGSFRLEATAPRALGAVSVSDDGALALAAGAAGTVLARDARGVWRAVKSAASVDLHTALVEQDHAYVAGDEGTLLEATTAQLAFSPVITESHATLWALEDL